MEVFKTVVDLVGTIAWPLTVLILLAMFRREIRQRVSAMTEVKFPGGKVVMRAVEQQVAASIASGQESVTKRIEATIEQQLATVNRDVVDSVIRRVLEDLKDTFETLQLQATAVAEELVEPVTSPQASTSRSLPAVQLDSGAPRVIRWIARNEDKYEFFSVKFLREKIFAADPSAQRGLQFCIEKGLLETYDLPNPNDAEHPTKACRLNRRHPLTSQIIG